MKLTGSFLIILASIISSYFYEKHKKREISSLKEIKDFLEHVKNQIFYFSLPLDRIYKEYSPKSEIIDILTDGNSFSQLTIPLKDELYRCFSSLGKGYVDEQISILEYTVEKINVKIDELERAYNQKIKVFRAISLFIGCSAIILLV